MADTDRNPTTDTGSGAYVGGNVDAQTFVGRDINLNLEIQATGAELADLARMLTALLSTPGALVRDGKVLAGGDPIDVSPARVDALRQYLDKRPAATQAERIDQYLLHLCVNPEFHRWRQRYVALSGGYRSAPELTPNYSAIMVRGEGPQRQIERVPLPDIRDALDEHPTFILLAQPGAGKTTVLQRIALDKAFARLQAQDGALIPLFARLSAQRVDESPQAFLARTWREEMPGRRVDAERELGEALRNGQLCILCDALNEARREKYTERMHDWRDFARSLQPGNQLVFSCRKLDYGGELTIQQVEVDALDEGQIQEFAIRYLDDGKGAAFWQALNEQHDDLLELAEIPYYLHMLVEVFDEQGELPPHRARLFAQFVFQLFGREQQKRHAVEWIDPAAQHLALSELAYAMQALGEGTQVDQDWALSQLPAEVRLPDGVTVETPPDDLLALARAASFLTRQGDGATKFTHHLMQEYFAADALIRRHEAGEELSALWRALTSIREMPPVERGEWDPLPGPPTNGWEQTTVLAAGLYAELYNVVQPINPALATRCLLESGAERNAERIAQSRNDLLDRVGNVAVHVRSRIEAGLLLGRLGDPRFSPETVNGVQVIPPPTVKISGGDAKIGSGIWQLLRGGFSEESPRHAVTLAPYAIGRYPVTNAEYACFMAAGGYEDERYWTAGGRYWLRGEPVPGKADPADWWVQTWREFKEDPAEIDRRIASGWMTQRDADNTWRILITWSEERVIAQVREWYPEGVAVSEPRYWRDDSLNNVSQPVVGVCWYEAMAYANWLAEISGQPYRLPTEPEWEWAARRGGRTYPWGNGWNAEKLNSLEGENRVMRTTPVGVYPNGATPDGIEDMAGNVWEWTATRFAAYPYDLLAGLEDPDATGLRVNRGGGWSANRKMVRCASRYWSLTGAWSLSLGLRLARLLSH